MSHIDTGFAVKDIEAMRQVIAEQCPQLELVEQNTYRTWISDHGSLYGDFALPGVYQLRLLLQLLRTNPEFDLRGEAEKCGVTLPENLTDLETTPWTVEQEKQLLQNAGFKAAYDHICENVIGKDATYVIRYREELNKKQAYEIGLVPNPLRAEEFSLVTDYWQQGQGILSAEGIGKANEDGVWGSILKLNYSVAATERHAAQGVASGAYRSYTKQPLPEGGFSFEIVPN